MWKALLAAFAILSIRAGYTQGGVQHLKGSRPPIDLAAVPESAYKKGIISIKFKRSAESVLQTTPSKGQDGFVKFNIPAVDQLNKFYQVSKATRAFEPVLSGKMFYNAHRNWGFDMWYQLEFPVKADIKKMISDYSKLADFVEIAEPVYKKQLFYNVPPRFTWPTTITGTDFIPNDSRFAEQWQYHNTGQEGGTAGKDIKLQEAWEIETGNPNVIVAVIDQGIEISHPDLSGNIWFGKGFNFTNNNQPIDPGEHGTHTAGTIAAVSNNNRGVSGIAGGNGSAGSGVKLMSLEVFGPAGEASNFGLPFVWAADRGVAITQNSWGYQQPDIFEQMVMDGIDYFIAVGGGNVLQGGLVIFAAGNNDSEAKYYPGYYYKTLTVAATNNRDERASYSNYGTYIDISAPGGEQSFTNDPHGILSTGFNGTYQFLQGTSMACPHVSGVAALMISEAPGRFSNDDIKTILMSTTDDHYPENSFYYAGKLGTGRLNALKALQKVQELAGNQQVSAVSEYNINKDCSHIELTWNRNADNDNAMIAYSFDGKFGLPSGNYQPGDTIQGGGKVIYIGNETGFLHPIPQDSVDITYKIWSVSNTGFYSAGLIKYVKTPYTVTSFSAISDTTGITLDWTKACPNSDVLIASSPVASFGVPQGNLVAGDTIPGGGTVIYRGSETIFTDENFHNAITYYRIWPVVENNYAAYHHDVAICLNSVKAPLAESFESEAFPPSGWSIINADTGSMTWERTLVASRSGMASARMQFRNYPDRGHADYLCTPGIDITGADSVIVSFERAYRVAGGGLFDTLEMVVSTDCGSSFASVWRKGGSDLATIPGAYSNEYMPDNPDWVKERINIKPYVRNAANVTVAFRAINDYGQNLYIDDVNITPVKIHRIDAVLRKIIEPFPRICAETFVPAVRIDNIGRDTLKRMKVYYRINSGVLDSVQWLGSLSYGRSTTVSLKQINLSTPGQYVLTVFTKDPNNLPDGNTSNDTASLTLTIRSPQTGSIKEGFEGSTFLPVNWFADFSGNAYGWERTTLSASEGSASAWIRNYRYHGNRKPDDMYSPLLRMPKYDSVYLRFDVAHAPAKIAGVDPLDTLEVFVTTDCGKTMRSIYKKWGLSLSSVGSEPLAFDVNDTIGFVPSSAAQWRSEIIDITRWVDHDTDFEVVFRNVSNHGNNTFLDKIEISAIILPGRLKKKGYIILPNPFAGAFIIRHLAPPVDLRAVQVMNTQGQLIVNKVFNENASALLTIDAGKYANGVYLVKMIYTGKVITERIIKQQ